MAQPSVDVLEFAIQIVTTFPFNVLLILGVIGFIVYYIYTSIPRKDDMFEVEDFRDSVYSFCEKLMDTFGIESESHLVRGIELQGKIAKWYPLRQKMKEYKLDPQGKKLLEVKTSEKLFAPGKAEKGKDTPSKEEYDAIIFQLGRHSIFSFITGSKPKFVILERSALSYNAQNKTWAMDESVSLIPYANVFIASKKSEQWINNISFMRSQEEVLTYSQNFARKTAWLELDHVKLMDYILGKEDKKRAGFENWRRKALGYEGNDDDED